MVYQTDPSMITATDFGTSDFFAWLHFSPVRGPGVLNGRRGNHGQAINFIRSNRALTPDRPFFIYFAPGGTHGPHHVHKTLGTGGRLKLWMGLNHKRLFG